MPSPDGVTIEVSSPRRVVDRVEEVAHLAALVHDVVREEEAAAVQPRQTRSRNRL